MKTRTITQVKKEIASLTDYYSLASNPRVSKLIEQIRNENAGRIAELKKELVELENNKPQPKPRWPENTPEDVLLECEKHWYGTVESRTYRIHCWNDKIICTSYPAGGYSDNGGWHPTQATFYFLSRTEKRYDKAKDLAMLEGRQSKKMLQQKLDELTNDLKKVE